MPLLISKLVAILVRILPTPPPPLAARPPPPPPMAVPIIWLPLAGPPNAPNPVSKLKPEPVTDVPDPVFGLPEILRNEPSMLVNVSFDIAN